MATIQAIENKRHYLFTRVKDLLKLGQAARVDSAKIIDFELRYQNLSELVTNFDALQMDIVSMVDPENLQTQDDIQREFDDVHYSVKGIYHELFPTGNRSPVNSDRGSVASPRPHIESCVKVKLPKIEVPKFDGDIKNWPVFYDTYKRLIHDNVTLSDIERFQYLISYLSGEPLTIVRKLPTTGNNYPISFQSLVDRYQDKRVLLTRYWQGICNVEPVSGNPASSLRNLLSVFTENLSAIDTFQADMWDFTKLNLLLQKLDNKTKNDFEIKFGGSTIPKYEDLYSFLQERCKAYETTVLTSSGTASKQPKTFQKSISGAFPDKQTSSGSNFKKQVSSFVTNTTPPCLYCKQDHSLSKCSNFLALNVRDRHSFVKQHRLCFNCFAVSHSNLQCTSKFNCRQCNKRHHTLLHFSDSGVAASTAPSKTSSETPNNQSKEPNPSSVNVMTNVFSFKQHVLLATAIIQVRGADGHYKSCRALLDSASQASFITSNCANRLNLPKSTSSISIQGVNQMTSSTLGTLKCVVKPPNEASFEIEMIVIPSICSNVSSSKYLQRAKPMSNLSLADPDYGDSGVIDILLGADVYACVLKPGLIKGKQGEPSAINTIFGWVLIGPISTHSEPLVRSFHTSMNDPLDTIVRKFWELEQIPEKAPNSPSNELCEQIFVDTHYRDATGRYVVHLPFQEKCPSLGDSYNLALRRFLSLENRLEKDSSLYKSYSDFMKDYLEQGHMVKDTTHKNPNSNYFIPHHCVVKDDGHSQKLRVVFDASAKSSNGISLNDTQLVGPKLQKDIFSLLLSFRVHEFVFVADIRQMYRQIRVVDSHQNYQRILWRFSKSDPIEEYRLQTVTYGVSSSPYLAIRCLLQLAQEGRDQYPLAAKALESSVYVDDVLDGANTIQEACALQQQLISLLSSANFELRKWASNCSALLSSVPLSHQQPHSLDKETSSLKVLGLQWCPVTDSFSYRVEPIVRSCTKRHILSEIARIYDPLGFLSPLTLFAKHLIQCLWSRGIDWDDPPPPELLHRWSIYKSELPCLSTLSIPRRVVVNNVIQTELHGFCDASNIAFSAVVYLRQVVSNHENPIVTFVCAKSKVAPLKRISIPRLELCAAVLLSDLLEFVLQSYSQRLCIDKIYAWSDSSVALSWIRSSPHRWKTFVANRVSHIQEKVAPNLWHHISSSDNPADCGSRGLLPRALVSHPLWWAGPPWLSTHSLPNDFVLSDTDLPNEIICEERQTTCLVSTEHPTWINLLLEKFSSLTKIQRIVAYCQRFIDRLRKRLTQSSAFTNVELYRAMVTIVRDVQKEIFDKEYVALQNNQQVSKPFRKLAPFIDLDGVIRVGGRLRHSSISFDAKHPMLLPRSHRLTDLIIIHFHETNLHPGPRTLQGLISQQFWILSPRRAIHHVLSKCNRCFRTNPSGITPLMGDLPSMRVCQVKPFSQCGVDFAGPLFITLGKSRGAKSMKAYICVFVCFAIKALHLELVSDLSSEAFLAALRRFIARRGRCEDIYSDCGTNFVGANKLLLSCMQEATETLGIKWHFNPPSTPHFGGLWEAGVKSVKTHLRRVVGDQILTFEELSTVLTQIEAVLNSRPLCSLSTDPHDLSALTPGHFLTLEPLCAPPDRDLTGVKLNRLTRWQLLQRLHQDFWRRWHKEYLHTLQQRTKWTSDTPCPSVGSLVLIKDESTMPLHWPLGRIVRLYPGRDNIPRVAQVKTIKGLIDRPIIKLCPLSSQ